MRLYELAKSNIQLSLALKQKGINHKSYKFYTSMKNACKFRENGYIYLSNGQNWNDIVDRDQMTEKRVYGKCFSYYSKENIAMWMLYGENGGKEGAMIELNKQHINNILNCISVDLGSFQGAVGYVASKTLQKGEFEIFFSDIIYTDESKSNNKYCITLADDHANVHKKILNNQDIFCKDYAWSYERETRLIIRPLGKHKNDPLNSQYSYARIKIPLENIRIVRSPIYSGKINIGNYSYLNNKVSWDL